MNVITCSALRKVYRHTVAVASLDLEVRSSEVFGFLGPNGAGKTTTLRMLLGLVRPTSGMAVVLGRPAGDATALSAVGALVEEPAAYPWLTGRANLQILADTGPPVPRAAIDVALERAGAAPFAGQKVGSYSQGMRQRLGLAGALLRRPRLLLLDEPTNGLDPAGIKEFRTVVRTLADEGMTVVLSSHLLSEVEQVCDRVVVLVRGRILADAAVADLLNYRSYRVEVQLAEVDAAKRALAPFAATEAGRGVLTVTAPSGRDVAAALAAAAVYPESLAAQRPSLESWYLSLAASTVSDVQREADGHAPAAS